MRKKGKPMGETADGMSRQDRIREAYGRAGGDHDHSPRSIEDYLSTKDFLPAIRAAVPDVTLEEVFRRARSGAHQSIKFCREVRRKFDTCRAPDRHRFVHRPVEERAHVRVFADDPKWLACSCGHTGSPIAKRIYSKCRGASDERA
jgi:hypothetical protein